MSTVLGGTYDLFARLVKSGTPAGASKTIPGLAEDPSLSYVDHDLGGVTDLWGSTWTPAEINTSLAVDCWFDLGSGTAATPFEFDAVGVTVYYTEASGQRVSQTIWMGMGLHLGRS